MLAIPLDEQQQQEMNMKLQLAMKDDLPHRITVFYEP
ncbi:YolD-like family protein [Virgibacillus salexigens]|nr:YolD-like family protein [Virgibacillus massiliensis]